MKLGLSLALLAGCHADKRPNILFLMADSMDGRVVDNQTPQSAAIELPFLRDFFLKEGTSFVRTYANSPQCVPSRASMCTGRRTDQIEAWSNEKGLASSPHGELDETCVKYFGAKKCTEYAKTQRYNETMFTAMSALGYGVDLYGKVDIGAGLLNNHSLHGVVSANGWHTGPTVVIATRTADIRKPTKPEPLAITNDQNNNVHEEDWRTVQRCEDWISTLPGPGQSSKPFFLYCSVNIPHPSFQTNATWLSKVHIDKIPKPQWPDGFPNSWHPYDSYMSESKHVGAKDISDDEILKVRKTYYAMCAETDYLLGRVWKALTQKGYSLDDTYVIYLSDHGEMNMEHRQVWKNSMYEASSRVPFQIAGPGIAKGKRVEQLTSLVDVFPTLLDMAQEKDWAKHAELVGKSLLPLANSGKTSLAPGHMAASFDEDRTIFSQYHSNMANTGSFMVRKGPWKYITFGHTLSTYSKDIYRPQLFNVQEDPEELHDVSQAESSKDVIAQLDKELNAEFDPQDADRRAVMEDKWVYDNYFATMPKWKLKQRMQGGYTGFDNADWQKIQKWSKEIGALGSPVVV